MANFETINGQSILTREKVSTDPHNCNSIPFYLSWRMLVIVVTFFGANLHVIMRNIVGITMVCMVNSTSSAFNVKNSTTLEGNGSTECGPSDEVLDEYLHGQFDWSNMQQSYIFAGLAWGQLVTTLPAGIYCDKYSIKKIILACFILGGICTSLVPVVAPWGYLPMTALRIFLGFYAGAVWPCFNALVAHWVPAVEMSTLYGLVTAGNQLGIVLFMPFSTFLCQQRHLFGGWPLAYYSTGALTFAWCFVWWFLVTDYPDQHKYISKAEACHIAQGRKPRVTKATRKDFERPYRQVICSPTSLACVLCLTGGTWGVTCLVYYLPTYFRDVMFFELGSNGEFSALPFLCQFVFKLIFSRLADRLKQTKMNSNWIMRGFNTIGMFSLAGFLFGMTFLNCNQSTLAVFLICMAMGLYSAVTPGFLASSLLIAPRHAGLLTAWANFLATFSQLALPYLVGAVVVNSTSSEWRLIFAIGSIIQIFSGVVFLIWGSGEEQKWAKASPQSTEGHVPCGSRAAVPVVGVSHQHRSIEEANSSQIKDEPACILHTYIGHKLNFLGSFTDNDMIHHG